MYFTKPGLLQYAEASVRLRIAKAAGLARAGERGASAIEWVVISAILILIAVGAGALIRDKIITKAGDLDLNKGP